MNAALETIYSRASVRNFTGQPIEGEKLGAILKAGIHVPSGKTCRRGALRCCAPLVVSPF